MLGFISFSPTYRALAASEAADDECAAMCADKRPCSRIVDIVLALVAIAVTVVAVTHVFIRSI